MFFDLRHPRTMASVVISGLILAASATQPAAQAAPAPIYWGAYNAGKPGGAVIQSAFQQDAGKGQSIIHIGQPWVAGNVATPFPASAMESVRKNGSIPLLSWGSWDSSGPRDQSAFKLSAITSGTYDAYLTTWAQAARADNHPFFLRFDWEMNGTWQFPWAEQCNGNQPGDYIRMWRHVHDIFVAQGATNITWVWSPNVGSSNTRLIASLYPGDSYVDWTAFDGYNFGTDHGNVGYKSFDNVFLSSYQSMLRLAPNKPMMVAETATSQNGGSPSAWITDALTVQLPTRYPAVKAVVWFNWNAGDTTLDWPIETTSAMQAAFKQAIGSSYYAANTFGTLPNTKINPL